MGHAVLAIAVPMAVGLASGHLVPGVLAGVGGLLASMADRAGPYWLRVRRVVFAAFFGGAAGLLIGIAISGRGWVAVPVMIAVAGASAVLSSAGVIVSSASLFLLVYAALGSGAIGALRPWWETPVWFLIGSGWWLLLLVPGWLAFPRAAEQRQVADVYRALAAYLRGLGSADVGAARRGVVTAINTAFTTLLGERATASVRDQELALLMTLVRQARLAHEAAATLDYTGQQAPSAAAQTAAALAGAVLDGTAVPDIPAPAADGGAPAAGDAATGGAAVRELNGAHNDAADVLSGRTPPSPGVLGDADWPRAAARPLSVLAWRVLRGFAGGFALRLMLCIGVATAFSQALPLQRSYWVPLTVAVVLRPDLGSVFTRALQSAAGTIIGASAGALILASRPPDELLVIWVAALALLLPYGLSRNYGLFTVFFAPLIVLLIDLLAKTGWSLAQDRLIDALLGSGIALVIGYAPWPLSWHGSWRRDFAGTLDAIAAYLDQAVGKGARGTAPHSHARIQLASLQDEFQQAMTEPQWTRQRAIAWQPAMAALERLLNTVTATAVTAAGQSAAGHSPSGEDVQALSVALRKIASAVRSGTPVDESLPSGASLTAVTDAAHAVADAINAIPASRSSLEAGEGGTAGRRDDRVVLRGVDAGAEHVAQVPLERVAPRQAVVADERDRLGDRVDGGPRAGELHRRGPRDGGSVRVFDRRCRRVDQRHRRAQRRVDLADRRLEPRQRRQRPSE
jgi:uncharacterized membrane protein YccC